VLRLTLLAPAIVEAILGGRQPADLQLEDLLRRFPVGWRTPRRALMTATAKQEMATKLRPFAGTPFDIGFGEGDGEQADCAWDLEEILASAGWNQLPWGVHAVGIAVIHRNLRPLAGSVGAQNIEIQLEPAHRQGRLAAAEALVATLNSAGIGAREAPYNSANTIVGG
jgi:hypothetical protein